MTKLASIIISLLLIAFFSASLAYGQRGGRGGGGVGGIGVSRGTGVGTMNGGGIGGVGGVDRRTAVIAGAINNGNPGDRIGHGRPGIGGGVAYPGLAAAAVARRVPIGTVIEVLPPDCSMTFITEMQYYYCSGQYYQPMGSESSPIYVAAEPYIPEY